MEGDKISVIVPAYNVENYIENAVKSICNQNYRNIEIILVNDGSDDKTPEILDKLAKTDERINVIHKENGGVTSARLRGVKEATGEWIGFMDGDDYIEPQMYEILIENALKYHTDISHCGYQLILPNYTRKYYGTNQLIEQDEERGLKDLLEGKFVEPGLCNKLFKKELLKEFLDENKMDLSIKSNEDLLMNFYLFQKSKKSVYEDKCLYNYVLRKNSATTMFSEHKLKNGFQVLSILEKETENSLELNKIIKQKIIARLIFNATIIDRKNKKLIQDYQKFSRIELKKRFAEVMSGEYSLKQKLMVLWVRIWPFSYGVVHALYAYLKKHNQDLKQLYRS